MVPVKAQLRLKPRCSSGVFGTTEVVPFHKTEFFAAFEVPFGFLRFAAQLKPCLSKHQLIL